MCRFRAERSRVASACATFLIVAAIGCVAGPRASLDDIARQYVRLAVALGERDPDSLDFYAGPDEEVADVRKNPPPLAAIQRDAEALAARLAREPIGSADVPRVRALTADLHAIVARVDLLTGTKRPFDRESLAFFGVVPAPIDDRRLEPVRSAIAGQVGGRGRLVDRYVAFAGRFVVPGERLPAVMQAAIDECRRRTIAHVALPAGEQVTLAFVRDKPWSAFSRYTGDGRSVMQVNTDFQFTVDQALQVACHEAYPGHHTRNSVLAPRRDARGRPPERSVQLLFTHEALASEASAMLASEVAFSADQRIAFLRDRLFPLAGLDPAGAARHAEVERLVGDLQIAQVAIARRYLDGELEFARAVTALEDLALVPHADALVKYLNQYRTYLTTYTVGRQRLAARFAACAGADPADTVRWRCFENVTSPR